VCNRGALLALWLLAAAGAAAEDAPVRDPMRPFGAAAPGVAGVARPRFELSAVLISPTRCVAIVNGKPYLQGAVVDGAEIVAIEPRLVRLRERGEEREVSLGRPASGPPSVTQGGNGP